MNLLIIGASAQEVRNYAERRCINRKKPGYRLMSLDNSFWREDLCGRSDCTAVVLEGARMHRHSHELEDRLECMHNITIIHEPGEYGYGYYTNGMVDDLLRQQRNRLTCVAVVQDNGHAKTALQIQAHHQTPAGTVVEVR